MAAPPSHQDDPGPSAAPRSAVWPNDASTVGRLFRDYREWLAAHQDRGVGSRARVEAGLGLVDRLISELPGPYGPPRGDVLLWAEGADLVACGALRELEPGVGELKRIFVREDYRGKEFGHPFVRTAMSRARELGYRRLRVDTLPTMAAAIEFYQELGFRPIAAFWPHPVANALYFERDLHAVD